jgi:hypothetical protein
MRGDSRGTGKFPGALMEDGSGEHVGENAYSQMEAGEREKAGRVCP